MSTKYTVPILVIWTLSIAVYKFSTGYGPVGEPFPQAVRSLGYAAAPWLLALIWATIVMVGSSLLKRRKPFRSSYLPAVVLFLALVTAVQVAQVAAAQTQSAALTPRDAALQVMGASLATPGLAAYCIKTYRVPAEVFGAVKGWTERHEALTRKAIQVIEANGGLSREERKEFDQTGFMVIRSVFEGDTDPASTCRGFASALAQGTMEMKNQDELKEAVAIIEMSR